MEKRSFSQAIKENAKGIVAFVTALGTWGGTALADGELNAVEAFGLTGVFLAGFTVWAAANAPSAQQLKDLAAAIRQGPKA